MNDINEHITPSFKKTIIHFHPLDILKLLFYYSLFFVLIAPSLNESLNISFDFNIAKVSFFSALLIIKMCCGVELNAAWFFFLLSLIPSILFNDIPVFFRPWTRFLYFFLLLAAIGPLFYNPKFNDIVHDLWKHFKIVVCTLTILSLLYYFIDRGNATHGGSNLPRGLFVHSMVLSPISGLSTLFFFDLFTKSSSLKNKKIGLLFFGGLITSFYTIIVSASRIALLALICSLVAFILLSAKSVKKISFFILAATIIVAFSSFIIRTELFSNIVTKFNADQDRSDSLLVSRKILWDNRVVEFHSSPIYGIGFCSLDINDERLSFEGNFSSIEPGNSWLFVLSSTGILGFACLFYCIFMEFFDLYKAKNSASQQDVRMLLCLIVYFIIHMFAEGYVFSSGNVTCCFFWLILMFADNCNKRIILDQQPSASLLTPEKA